MTNNSTALKMKTKTTKKTTKAKSATKSLTFEQHIAEATQNYENGNLEEAAVHYVAAYGKQPENTQIMDALSDVYMQMGDFEKALLMLTKSTDLAPHDNPLKWMFLGQLQNCTEAVDSYRRGIDVLTASLDNPQLADVHDEYRKQIAKAHCGITDIYMTDLCEEEDAEAVCEAAVAAAIAVDPTGIDGLITQVDLRMTQAGIRAEAESRQLKLRAAQTLEELFIKIKAVTDIIQQTSLNNRSEESQRQVEAAEAAMPDFDSIVRVVKLLIECGSDEQVQQASLVEHATELLTSLLHFSDDEFELWELKATSFLKHTPPDTESAMDCYKKAMALLIKEKLMSNNNGEEFQNKEAHERISRELKQLKNGASMDGSGDGNGSNNNNNNGGGDMLEDIEGDEEWSDCDDDDDDQEGAEAMDQDK